MRAKRGFVVVMAFGLLTMTARFGFARCDATGADAGDVAAARAAVAANCDCAGPNHGQYVRCAAEQARNTLVNPQCRGAVVKCAAKSTCGKAGFVTCCRTNSAGVTKCSIKASATKCTPPKSGSACVGNFPSCCDACSTGGCPGSPSGAFFDLAR